jgi:hypothetical protein
MSKNTIPSTRWKEVIAPDEAERHARQGQLLRQLQQRQSTRQGRGRGLHRKQLAVAQGTLEVLDGLPGFLRYGLFAEPQVLDVWVRLSNGGPRVASDAAPDVRGFAIRVWGVKGESALGIGPATCQDFTLINQEAFAFPGSEEFVNFVVAAAGSKAGFFKYLYKTYGVVGAARRLGRLVRSVGRPFSGFANENFYSAVPMACGPYAVRARLVPSASNGPADPRAQRNWGLDLQQRLQTRSLHWDLQLQYFVSETHTPIENASVDWPTPYETVARLMLPAQNLSSDAGQALALQCEEGVFDPWQALAEHRPLGEVQRARKVAYFESQKGRGLG